MGGGGGRDGESSHILDVSNIVNSLLLQPFTLATVVLQLEQLLVLIQTKLNIVSMAMQFHQPHNLPETYTL